MPRGGGNERVTLRIAAAESRTALEENGRVVWTEGDEVLINGEFYEVTPDPEDPSQATIPGVAAADSYLASYNYENYYNGMFGWPFRMNFVDDGFAPYASPMGAYSTDGVLRFRQLGGLVRFGLTGDSDVEIVSIRLQTDFVPVNYTLDPERFAAGEIGYVPLLGYGDNDTFTLNCPEGQPLALDPETPRWFCFCLPPHTYEGFSFEIETADGRSVYKRTTPGVTYTVESEKIYTLPPVAFGLSEGAAILEAEIDSRKAPRISYTLTGEPSATVATLLMTQKEYALYADAPEDLTGAMRARSTLLQLDSEGIRSASSNAMPASTDCVLLYAYVDGDQLASAPAALPVRTDDAQSPAPTLTVTQAETANPTSEIFFTVHTDETASAIAVGMYSKEEYDQYVAEGWDDIDLLLRINSFYDEEGLAMAASPDGILLGSSFLTAGSEHIVLVLALGPDGAPSIDVQPFRTEYYFDPAAEWTTVSTSATMECGIFNVLGVPHLTVSGLTVEKMAGRELYRVVNPFVLERIPELAAVEYLTQADEGYIYMDATDPDDVIVEGGVSQLNLIYGVNRLFVATYSHLVGFDTGVYATYDAASGTFTFPGVNDSGYSSLITSEGQGLYICEETVIRLNP